MKLKNSTQPTRIDKWLWAVRVYKTRTLATKACHAGHVKINGERVKPSREVHIGEVIEAKVGPIVKHIKVLGYLEQRVGPKIVSQYAEDLTPPQEYEKLRNLKMAPIIERPRGTGRPTKKERRMIEKLKWGF